MKPCCKAATATAASDRMNDAAVLPVDRRSPDRRATSDRAERWRRPPASRSYESPATAPRSEATEIDARPRWHARSRDITGYHGRSREITADCTLRLHGHSTRLELGANTPQRTNAPGPRPPCLAKRPPTPSPHWPSPGYGGAWRHMMRVLALKTRNVAEAR